MNIAYITAGAAGMLCGSCLHDNTLAAALIRKGQRLSLIPTYTPIRTDEADVSLPHIFYGGINVYLQQKSVLFRKTPWFLDRLLDRPSLLNVLSRFSSSTDAADLGDLTESILRAEEGRQKKELEKLIQWLKEDLKPDLVQLTNSMFAGMARTMKAELKVPVLCALQGEDIFVEGLPEKSRTTVLALLKDRCRDIDGFIATSKYFADFISRYLEIDRSKIHVVRLGISTKGYGHSVHTPEKDTFTIGYLARICPEKGLHFLVDAFHRLAEKVGKEKVCLKAAGYLGKRDHAYLDNIKEQVKAWDLSDQFEYIGEVDRQGKLDFLQSLDVFSVPTTYREPKGLYVLEALASGVPVVQPAHGAFPELIQATGGGILVEPNLPESLADGIHSLMLDFELRAFLGNQGRAKVHQDYNDDVMADATLKVYEQYGPRTF
jgi:glycosyltransferase involved in cell wall biosynthesis